MEYHPKLRFLDHVYGQSVPRRRRLRSLDSVELPVSAYSKLSARHNAFVQSQDEANKMAFDATNDEILYMKDHYHQPPVLKAWDQ